MGTKIYLRSIMEELDIIPLIAAFVRYFDVTFLNHGGIVRPNEVLWVGMAKAQSIWWHSRNLVSCMRYSEDPTTRGCLGCNVGGEVSISSSRSAVSVKVHQTIRWLCLFAKISRSQICQCSPKTMASDNHLKQLAD